MSEDSKFQQAQQTFQGEWQKWVLGGASQIETALNEIAKIQSKAVAKALAGIDEAGQFARESVGVAERVGAEWRKLALEATRKTAEALTQKQA